MSKATAPAGPMRTWLATVPILLILVVVVLQGTAVMLHGQLLRAGESLYAGYSELRTDPEAPTCDPETIGQPEPGTEANTEEDDFLDDLFADEPATEPEAADEPDGGDFLDDLFDDAGQGDSGGGPSEAAIEAARAQCAASHDEYASRLARITGGVRAFRGFERGVARLVDWANSHTRHILVFLILVCGVVATGLRSHIALRSIKTVREDRISQVGQLAANLTLFFSSIVKYRIDQGTGLEIQHASLPILWMTGFGMMAVVNIHHLVRPPAKAEAGSGYAKPLLTVPLYAVMAISAGFHFLLIENHPAGPAIYLQKLTENAKLYVQVGLYVWTGMLLKRTRIARMCFDVVRPWKLPPELLAPLVVAAAAIPTAYSGASGIFVIAAGAVIYDELRRAGARRQLAIAATAMAGSLGVVLSPCLLVVVVAALNYEVTTAELYHWGWRVYGLSATLFLIACVVTRRNKFTIAPWKEALRGSLEALKPLVPYAVFSALILAFYAFALGTRLNEHTAPIILPIMMIMLLLYDRRAARSVHKKANPDASPKSLREVLGFGKSMVTSTDEATVHCGALLMLMGLSMSVGGVIERGELMAMVPDSFGSVWLAMGVLVFVLVFIGMIMDPYGAVILVSVTLAPVAYANGINPLHFWMVVLAAFELGYLTPPVALNQLLTRQVIREEPEVEAAEAEGATFWQRYESILLPLVVMAIRLFIVALIPLWFY